MAEIYFNSDSHGEDEKIALMRGFTSVQEHMEYIADRWISSVRKDDIVFDLGDLGIRNPDAILELYKKLPGTKHLIWGNHDAGFPANKKAYNKHKRYLEVFESVSFVQRLKTHGVELFLSHMPYTGEHDDRFGNAQEDRYAEFRFPNLGLWNVHGHVHDAWKVRDNMINVGVEVWPEKLASIQDILEIVKGNNN